MAARALAEAATINLYAVQAVARAEGVQVSTAKGEGDGLKDEKLIRAQCDASFSVNPDGLEATEEKKKAIAGLRDQFRQPDISLWANGGRSRNGSYSLLGKEMEIQEWFRTVHKRQQDVEERLAKTRRDGPSQRLAVRDEPGVQDLRAQQRACEPGAGAGHRC
ncbi:unnamed protein product [Prorocentrum cordatum]|uniref:Uncharacterized protein n=1 Tax=Prorocentrum cordatum TaxID=2364126 RepID=A0ABN9QVU1_9DINO|nr:unnamed protein product [Polarella glacialis]